MRQCQLVEQRGQEDTPDPAVEVFERVNPLEAPVGPGQKLGQAAKLGLYRMPESFGEIVAEGSDMDGHFIEGRRRV